MNRSSACSESPAMDREGSTRAHARRPEDAHGELLEELTDEFRLRYEACLRLAVRMVRDRSLAEEVVQEAFLAAWQHGPSRFDPARGPLESWLLVLTRHKAVDAVRHAEHVRRVRQREEAEPRRATATELPEDVLLRLHAAAQVHRGLRELPAAQRRVLLLTYWAGLSQAQIAQRDGTPLGTVKTRTAAGLVRLRNLLFPEAARE